MSSLAAAKADNFYYPPDFDPKKHQTLNKYNGQHPLRERAAKLDQGILVIRFEIPFNIWCDKCGEHIAKGERFNAEKKAIGHYHSTKILQFTMSHHCGSKITIQTDPKNAEYLVIEGARKKEESYSAADAEVMELPDEAERERRQRDHFYRLEYQQGAKVKALSEAERLVAIHDAVDARAADPYTLNRAMRAALRGEKRAAAALSAERAALGLPDHVALLPGAEGDRLAAQVAFLTSSARAEAGVEVRRKRILEQDIFGGPAGASSDTACAAPAPAAAAAAAGRVGGIGDSANSGPLGAMQAPAKRQATALAAVKVRPVAANGAGFQREAAAAAAAAAGGVSEGGSRGPSRAPCTGAEGNGNGPSRDGAPAAPPCRGNGGASPPPPAVAAGSAAAAAAAGSVAQGPTVAAAATAPTGRPPPGAAALAAAAASRAAASAAARAGASRVPAGPSTAAFGNGGLKRSNKDRVAELQKRRAGPAGVGFALGRPEL